MDLLAPVKEEHSFILKDGRQIASLAELKSVIHEIDDSVFSHHVNENKNDFATWVNDIHQDKILALRLHDAKSKEQVSDAISDRVKELMSPKNSVVISDPVESKKSNVMSMKSRSLKVPILNKKTKKSNEAFELQSLKEPLVIKTNSHAKKMVTVNVPDESAIKTRTCDTEIETGAVTSLDLLRPKGSLKKSFFPFLKKDEKDIKKMSFEDIRQDKCPHKQFMQCGVYDFFKGAIIGMIIGALLALAML